VVTLDPQALDFANIDAVNKGMQVIGISTLPEGSGWEGWGWGSWLWCLQWTPQFDSL
jgi:hypothetical protein